MFVSLRVQIKLRSILASRRRLRFFPSQESFRVGLTRDQFSASNLLVSSIFGFKFSFDMNQNAFLSPQGELSESILLNVAEILTLRLPEGVGEFS